MEEETHGDPVAVAEENARRKALRVASALAAEARGAGAGAASGLGGEGAGAASDPPRTDAGTIVLGADTLVAVDGDPLGKPRDAAQARAYLARLAGRTHQVVGGIALAGDGALQTAVAITQVHFRPASPALLDWYVGTGEWQGRAGGYAIQGAGAALVAGLEGDYLNVVGLPLGRLLDLLPGLLPA